MKTIYQVIGIAALATASTGALAADMAVKAAPLAVQRCAADQFRGGYIGVNGGAVNWTANRTDQDEVLVDSASYVQKTWAGLVGAQAGYGDRMGDDDFLCSATLCLRASVHKRDDRTMNAFAGREKSFMDAQLGTLEAHHDVAIAGERELHRSLQAEGAESGEELVGVPGWRTLKLEFQLLSP